ncbi:MAG: TetR/AcrR family transcriptional regulator [Polyangiaceae bacterium]|nr:TetR/AcrR family transcriptional regulator [Polyangiaceae bacterium]MCE7891436.1 TetR/AcrR family transcriptional regulator [Sorangiineae bacterium PRO1]MCL4751569.1 TetR/AcrR family transcriptional regulator [Myxococcales bacterium]
MSRAAPAKRQREKRRSTQVRQVELADAALQIIATRGIAALTTRTLAAQVGLTGGAIFRHFPSLSALLDAVVERVEAVLDTTYPPAGLPARERLERFIEARSSAVGNQLGILRLVSSEQFQLALPNDGAARLGRCAERTRAFLVGAIREAQEEGTIRDDVEPAALSVVVMGTMRMLALSTAKAGPHGRPAETKLVRRALATLLEPPKPSRRKTPR